MAIQVIQVIQTIQAIQAIQAARRSADASVRILWPIDARTGPDWPNGQRAPGRSARAAPSGGAP
ncbi:hypothetical protein [Burkholderia metallica]|uniref:hypothetical protein n=1 Tax=Burkholderia metallica TaxID=488729 RepID=UPI000D1A5A67|nr:hypothetical protein [Burkholderia metallica]